MKHTIQERLLKADDEEIRKCKESPLYFYNKYALPKGRREITQEEYDVIVKQQEQIRNKGYLPKYRNQQADMPLMTKDCFIVK